MVGWERLGKVSNKRPSVGHKMEGEKRKVSGGLFGRFQTPFFGHLIFRSVRRHINRNNQRPDLKEDLAHLV